MIPAMPGPLTEPERDRIAGLLRDGHSRAEIARMTGRGSSTIQRVAKAIGFTADEQRQVKTANARAARSAFCAERRAEYAARLQEAAEALLDDLERPVTVYNFGGRDNTYNEHELPTPDIAGKRALIAASVQASQQVVAIDKHDNRDEGDLAAVDAWLRDVIHGGTE